MEGRRPRFLPRLPTPQLLLAFTQAVSTSHPVPHFPFPLPQLQTSPEKKQEENISQALHPQLSPKHGDVFRSGRKKSMSLLISHPISRNNALRAALTWLGEGQDEGTTGYTKPVVSPLFLHSLGCWTLEYDEGIWQDESRPLHKPWRSPGIAVPLLCGFLIISLYLAVDAVARLTSWYACLMEDLEGHIDITLPDSWP